MINKLKLNNEIDDIIKLYKSGKSCEKISQNYKCTSRAILYQLKKNNIKRRDNSQSNRIYLLNEFYFDNIDSEDKSYFLGLLYADGYHDVKHHKITLQLQKKDEHILSQISKNIKTNKPLQNITVGNRKYTRLAINSKYMSESLIKHGCIQKKTFNIELPSCLEEHLMNHFIRGYFDGDGCIYIDKNGQPEVSFTGNFNFIFKLHEYLTQKLSLNKIKLKKDSNSFTIRFRGKKICKKIEKYIYYNSTLYLTRKYERFRAII